ncbi:MAG: hypothetical protein BV458_10920 [Thermoplasmata archaeon M9B2D]|nr:MAG: hypothetical protein BV458_10920 [Thermoplasmata archaeon M9B2D]
MLVLDRILGVFVFLLLIIQPTYGIFAMPPNIGEVNDTAPWPTSEWSKTTPEEQGMNSAYLDSMIEFYATNEIQIDSLLVIRNGWVVFEEYPSTFGPNDTHHLFSCTKSIISTLIGIALRLGYLESINTSVLDYFPEREFTNPSEKKDKITIQNLLEMTSGLDWNEEQHGNVINDYNKMVHSEDWVKYVLDKPMAAEPGSIFLYNSGASHILSAIIQERTHNTTLEFAVAYLFQYLGITEFEWIQDPQGVYSGASGLKMKPLDMAKIGYLYIKDGLWDGVQLIPQDWVGMTTTSQVHVDETLGYSYQWWVLSELGAFYALGWGYQSIIVVPKYDLVVVVTAVTIDPTVQVEYILRKWIFPSLGLNSTISSSFSISPLVILIGSSPFIVMAIAFFMDRKGLWREDDSGN